MMKYYRDIFNIEIGAFPYSRLKTRNKTLKFTRKYVKIFLSPIKVNIDVPHDELKKFNFFFQIRYKLCFDPTDLYSTLLQLGGVLG
jgi:hypothetical protein